MPATIALQNASTGPSVVHLLLDELVNSVCVNFNYFQLQSGWVLLPS